MMALLQQSWNSAPKSVQTSDNLRIFAYTYTLSFSCSLVSDSLQSHGLQHARLPCASPTPVAYSNSGPSHWWCHPNLILCHPLLLPPSIFPSIGVFSNESFLPIRWPKYWSFSLSISPSNEYSGLISLRWTSWLSLQSKGLQGNQTSQS